MLYIYICYIYIYIGYIYIYYIGYKHHWPWPSETRCVFWTLPSHAQPCPAQVPLHGSRPTAPWPSRPLPVVVDQWPTPGRLGDHDPGPPPGYGWHRFKRSGKKDWGIEYRANIYGKIGFSWVLYCLMFHIINYGLIYLDFTWSRRSCLLIIWLFRETKYRWNCANKSHDLYPGPLTV